jgi:hypothetical protein
MPSTVRVRASGATAPGAGDVDTRLVVGREMRLEVRREVRREMRREVRFERAEALSSVRSGAMSRR